MKKNVGILITGLVLSFKGWSLEIDEKLTTRFLRVSATKKTVLLNRGLEDGLAVGDHAKFFLTTGVIARGMVVKASPTRSVWSLYRLVDGTEVFTDKIVNIKITSPLTITEDPTKALYDNSAQNYTAGTEVMSLRGDPGDTPPTVRTRENITPTDKEELHALGMGDEMKADKPREDRSKLFETYGVVHLSSLSSNVTEGDESTFAGKDSNLDFSVGVEKYFDSKQSILENLSLHFLVHTSSHSMVSVNGNTISQSVLEYGLGAHYHFIASPLTYGRLIGYTGFTFGIGKVSDTIDVLNSSLVTDEQTLEGTSSFLSLGIGLKYYLKSGFGFRSYLDYYRRSETYDDPNTEDGSLKKVASGPRLQVGLSYRF